MKMILIYILFLWVYAEGSLEEFSQRLMWERFGGSLYKFFIDVDKEVDTSRNRASGICKAAGASLVSIESEQELVYLKNRIRELVESHGERFGREEWWTSGTREGTIWIWENHVPSAVDFNLLNAEDVFHPVLGEQYLALAHDPIEGWQIKSLPHTFRLRYICEKPATHNTDVRPHEERLLAQLFKTYDRDARGSYRPEQTVNVSMDWVMHRIVALDEEMELLSLSGSFILNWTDHRLTWSLEQYSNISSIVVQASRIWLPELVVINGYHGSSSLSWEQDTRVHIHSNGQVVWEPSGLVDILCTLDVTYYPFDNQICISKFGSLSYTTKMLNVSLAPSLSLTHHVTSGGGWEVTSTYATWLEEKARCCFEESFSRLAFKVHLRRNSLMHILIVVLPSVLLTIHILLIFFIPPASGEKVIGGLIVILTLTVFVILTCQNIPWSSTNVPLIVIYLSIALVLATMSVCLSVCTMNIYHNHPNHPISVRTRKLCLDKIAHTVGIRRRFPLKKEENHVDIPNAESDTGAGCDNCSDLCNKVLSDDGDLPNSKGLMDGEVGKLLHKPACAGKDGGLRLYDRRMRSSRDLHHVVYSNENYVSSSHKRDWQDLARVMDRIFFILLLIIFIVILIFVIVMPWQTRK